MDNEDESTSTHFNTTTNGRAVLGQTGMWRSSCNTSPVHQGVLLHHHRPRWSLTPTPTLLLRPRDSSQRQ